MRSSRAPRAAAAPFDTIARQTTEDPPGLAQRAFRFLAGVERRAFKQAMFAVRDEEAALDIVQDAMLRLAEKYGHLPAAELPLLFHRIVQNAIRDWFRRQKVRSLWTTLLSSLSGRARGRRPGPAGNPARPPTGPNLQEAPAEHLEQAQVLEIIETRDFTLASTSTRGFHPALLGGTGRGRNRQGDGLLGGQRENALLPGGARFGGGAQGARHHARHEIMNERNAIRAQDPSDPESGDPACKPDVAQRLAQARKRALERHRAEPALAWADNVTGSTGWAGLALRVLVPLALLIACAGALYTWQQNQRAAEIEEVDALLLTDDLPIDAYLDRGFQNWLKKRDAEQ